MVDQHANFSLRDLEGTLRIDEKSSLSFIPWFYPAQLMLCFCICILGIFYRHYTGNVCGDMFMYILDIYRAMKALEEIKLSVLEGLKYHIYRCISSFTAAFLQSF
jgi:hypothetical protein